MCKELSCGKLLDRFCFEEYEAKRKRENLPIECGYCRKTVGFSLEVPPYIKEPLTKFVFKCANECCITTYSIKDAKEHIRKCKPMKVSLCLLGCSDKNKFRGIEKMRAHLQHDCVLMQEKCPRCDLMTTRRDKRQH